MDVLTLTILTFVAAAAGSFATLKYSSILAKRKQKSVLVLFIREFFLLIDRCRMYYKQSVNNAVSFSTLFEISDASTFIKLIELTEDINSIKIASEFKAGVFQAVRYSNKASECMIQRVHHLTHGNNALADQAFLEAKHHQNMALNFFIGEQKVNGIFYRNLYVKYTNNLRYLLDHLDNLNSGSKIKYVLNLIDKKYQIQKSSIDAFVLEHRKKLDLIIKIIELVRKKEEILFP